MKKSLIAATAALSLLGLQALARTPLPPEDASKPDPVPPSTEEKAEEERPKIEICFVLDTTGSMSGLIQAAKDKIWSIANEVVSTKPAPEIKFGLVAYRDRGDDYITQITDLSADIDNIYGKLMDFKAAGGGDGPESVNQALNEAVTKMTWSKDKDVLKIIFLVGDAPPHTDYKDDVQYAESCKLAMEKDLIVNTIQCGSDGSTTKFWKEIAELSEGRYIAIAQEGGSVAMATPFDDKIAALNSRLSLTVVAYGLEEERNRATSSLKRLEESKTEALAERLDFLTKADEGSGAVAGGGKVVSSGADLIEKLARDEIEVADIEEDKLSEEVKKMSKEEREAYFEEKLKERAEAQKELTALLKQRSEFITKEKAKLREAGEASGFDAEVGEAIREQAESKGIHYDK